ncbi:MAG TPA: phosphopentomutase [Candidatus Scatovivens faecipullorum]|nr:phosphopentomutase [Candidatus Scatovivens faecipullorum]
MKKRAIIIVLDSFGVGEAPDAAQYGDEGSNTLEGIYNNTSLNIPNMKKLGLYNIQGLNINEKEENPIGIYGKAAEKTKGKNSPVGHWEIAGFIKDEPFKTYYEGFPEELLDEIAKRGNIKGFLCNEKGSGTDFLKKYGEQSIETGMPIIYTSADSVLQIAAHEEKTMSVKELHNLCKIARNIIDEKGYGIGTVIARPFIGDCSENFARTYNRKDFEAEDFGKTMLDIFCENGKKVLAIGKIEDLFTGRGITRAIHTSGNADGIEKTIEAIKNADEDLIFTNLVDFDMLYGHRNNIEGYAKALEEFDRKLPEILGTLKEEDILILTADHGNDPSTPSTDHSREYIPILVYGKRLKENVDLGIRETYADISATILDIFELEKLENGKSFKNEIMKNE